MIPIIPNLKLGGTLIDRRREQIQKERRRKCMEIKTHYFKNLLNALSTQKNLHEILDEEKRSRAQKSIDNLWADGMGMLALEKIRERIKNMKPKVEERKE